VRLWGIDARSKQPWGRGAKEFTGDLAFGKVVTVRVRDIDRYKRAVAEIILPDGWKLNQELVRAGMAGGTESARNTTPRRPVGAGGGAAKRGLWADPSPVPPWEWRKTVRVVDRRREIFDGTQ
jgi:micrococcal nuclease